MNKNIFVNMVVKDLKKSKEFFTELGYTFNEQFTDETAAALVISENIYAMLLTHEKVKQFTKKTIVDSHTATEVVIAISCENKEEVDEMMEKVIAAGGTEARPAEDYGFMYAKSFEDPDGHIWEMFWMDPGYVKK